MSSLTNINETTETIESTETTSTQRLVYGDGDLTCTSTETCASLLGTVTLSLFYSDIRDCIYDPQHNPPFFQNIHQLDLNEVARPAYPRSGPGSRGISPRSVPQPGDDATLSLNSAREPVPEIIITRMPSQALQDYLYSSENGIRMTGEEREEEARMFAQYKMHYHDYVHDLALIQGISISRAWDEIDVRRWRRGLEEIRARENEDSDT
ncbi:hypothetical protein BJX76DRAFT_353856 [Aspergillus varians]